MIRKRDPREPVLISRFDSLLCRTAINTLKNGWEGIFRAVILELLPICRQTPKNSGFTTLKNSGFTTLGNSGQGIVSGEHRVPGKTVVRGYGRENEDEKDFSTMMQTRSIRAGKQS